MAQVNDWLGEEVVRFKPYEIPTGHDVPPDELTEQFNRCCLFYFFRFAFLELL